MGGDTVMVSTPMVARNEFKEKRMTTKHTVVTVVGRIR